MTTRRHSPGKVRNRKAAPRKKAAPARVRAAAGRKSAKAGAAAGVASATFPSDCTIAQADEMRTQLMRMLSKPASVTLDLSGIRRIDTAALQVLTAFIRERRAARRAVKCSGATETFLLTAQTLGLSAVFADHA
jgi:phospholipid transport system transporter-binding protein